MLTHPTSERLEALGFKGMAKALDEHVEAFEKAQEEFLQKFEDKWCVI